jgi:KUP system potassium uptake protein
MNQADDMSRRALALGALAIVFGDIGTSPLYALREAFDPRHGAALDEPNVLAVLSLIFWAVTLIVSLKYVAIALSFNNRGEGGILALFALSSHVLRRRHRLHYAAGIIAVAGAGLFFGDAVITPAISVLAAVEGVAVARPDLQRWVVPLALAVLTALFLLQRQGPGGVRRLFGPVILVWFLTLAGLGAHSIAQTPQVLAAVDPAYALHIFAQRPGLVFAVLGAVFLALTGAEALYADMGQVGPRPIRIAWFLLVFPALMLNYFGQGALLLRQPEALASPFYFLAPEGWLPVLVGLAIAATAIASQATIAGAFAVTQQAIRLGYFPRLPVQYTAREQGHIYIGKVNWLMLFLVLALVLEFGSSDALAGAYGLAVSMTMVLETALIVIVAALLPRRWVNLLALPLAVIGIVEAVFLASNSLKIEEGGWFPLSVAALLFVVLRTWQRGNDVLQFRESRKRVACAGFLQMVGDVPRVPGTAVFLTGERDAVPSTLLHNLKHNKVIHERVVFLRVEDAGVPQVARDERTEVQVIERGAVYQATLRYGFREEPDVIEGLRELGRHGLAFDLHQTTFFLGRATLAQSRQRTLFSWRRNLFRWMQKNSLADAEYFRLPPDRVVELGTQVTL